MKSRVLVTGGAGFIGSHLVRRLVVNGYNVSILDNLSTGNFDRIKPLVSNSSASFINGDIREAESVRNAVLGVDSVVHLAAIKDVQFSIKNPSLTFEVNTAGTKNLVDACVNSGVKRFVFISTSAVYGNARYLPIDEGHPLNPLSVYADSKIGPERWCISPELSGKLETVVFRLFNVYGQGQGADGYSGVISRFIDRLNADKPPVIYGDGSQTRDFVNVLDVVKCITLALETERISDQIFNIGSGRSVSILELAKLLSKLVGKDSLSPIHKSPREGEILHSQANIEKARDNLGFDPVIDLSGGLEELVKAV